MFLAVSVWSGVFISLILEEGDREWLSFKCDWLLLFLLNIRFFLNSYFFICCISLGTFPETLNCVFIISAILNGKQAHKASHTVMLEVDPNILLFKDLPNCVLNGYAMSHFLLEYIRCLVFSHPADLCM